jgi:hypothetical protein
MEEENQNRHLKIISPRLIWLQTPDTISARLSVPASSELYGDSAFIEPSRFLT